MIMKQFFNARVQGQMLRSDVSEITSRVDRNISAYLRQVLNNNDNNHNNVYGAVIMT